MKKTEALKQYREMSEEQILAQIETLKEALYELRVQRATSRLTKTADFASHKKAIARLNTVLTEKKAKS